MVTITVKGVELAAIKQMAQAAEIGGMSNIRSMQDRKDSLSEDQLVGQLGNYAGSLWMYGDAHPWKLSRWIANQHPKSGDNGSDIPGCNVDFKTSLMRASKDPMMYRLAVRPRERHTDWVYVLALVDGISESDTTVHLVGWVSDSELPAQPEQDGVFKGAYIVPAKSLHPLPPFKWQW